MRIFTVTSNDLGISWGPAIHYLELWNEFSGLGHRDSVMGLAPSWTRLAPIVAPRFPLQLIRVPNVPSLRQVVFDIFAAIILWRRRADYDIAYVRLSHWHWMQSLVLKVCKIPYVLEMNGLSKEDSGSAGNTRLVTKLITLQERMLVGNAKVCITVSDGISRAVRERFKVAGKVETIRNGVARLLLTSRDNANGPRKARRRLTGIYVGTFTPWDGAANIVSLAKRFGAVDFLMIGDGPGREELQAVATPNVKFVGVVRYQDLPNLYATADFGIVLYEYERHLSVEVSSLKTLEYVASGLPVFSTAVRGQDFIKRLEFGRLVEPGADLEDEFERFIGDLPRYVESYTKCSDAYFESLTWHRVAVQTRSCLGQLMAQ